MIPQEGVTPMEPKARGPDESGPGMLHMDVGELCMPALLQEAARQLAPIAAERIDDSGESVHAAIDRLAELLHALFDVDTRRPGTDSPPFGAKP